MNKEKRTDAIRLAILLAAGLCANDAMAFQSYGTTVFNVCAQAGNTVQADPCDTCHANTSAGLSAYNGGNTALIDYYCPAAAPPPPPPTPTCTDNDGDGYTVEGSSCGTPVDCNDNDPAIHPGATEICTDGIDNNCNSMIDAVDPNAAGCPVVTCTDSDGDGYSIEGGACGPVDCNDADATLNPGQIEICDDGIDNNCDGNIDAQDATCQAMQNGGDDVLEERHEEARRRHGGYSGSYYHRNNDDRDSDSDKSSEHEADDEQEATSSERRSRTLRRRERD